MISEGSILHVLKADNYRINGLRVILYDRHRPDLFPDGYLTQLYRACKASSRRSPMGILPTLFCGMRDLSHDAITSYLASRPVLIMEAQTAQDTFMEVGMAFPSQWPLTFPGDMERSMFVGYGMFRTAWGRPEAETLGMLGLAYLFLEFGVTAIHGLRYCENGLTARFTRRYGFKDNGVIPRYMLRGKQLVSAVASTLLIEDFEHYVEKRLVDLLQQGELENGQGRQSGTESRSAERDGLESDGLGQHRPAAER